VSKRTASLLAWSMCALSLVLAALSLFLLVLNLSYPGVPIYPFWAENTVVAVGFSPVGAVIASRISPKNPMGWRYRLGGSAAVAGVGGQGPMGVRQHRRGLGALA
jgi:hypothetical protein